MTQAAHTPTPWAVEDPLGADIGLWLVQGGLEAFQWSCIAMVTGDGEDTRHPDTRFITMGEQEANAAFIVRAVNSHDDLVAALKEAREYVAERADAEQPHGYDHPVGNAEMRLLVEFNAVLERAGA